MTRFRRTAAALAVAVVAGTSVAGGPAVAASQCATASGVYRDVAPWPQTRLGLDRVWPLSTGRGVTVAVVATGVDAAHSQFAPGQVLRGADVRSGRSSTSARTDCDGRGTFAAGLIASHPDPGGSTFVGVAPDATILPVRFTVSSTAGQNDDDARNLARGIQYATTAGADVIVVVSAVDTDLPALRTAVDKALAADVVVVSAGISVQSGHTYPTSYPGVLGVAGIDAAGAPVDNGDRGPAISVSAPGAGLVGPAPAATGHKWPVNIAGMSAAFAGGAVALLRSYRPEMSGPAVVSQLIRTATPLVAGGRSAGLGAGLIDPYAALTLSPVAHTAASAAPAHVVVSAKIRPGMSAQLRRSITLAGILAGLAALIVLAALVIRRRPARS